MSTVSARRMTVVYGIGSMLLIALLLPMRYMIGGDAGGTVFHVIAELITITIAVGTFMVAWNARRHAENGFLLFLGTAMLFIAVVDALHMMAYRGMGPTGMGLFPGYDTDLPTTLWIVARGLQASALLAAPFTLSRPVRAWPMFWTHGSITAAFVAAAFLGLLPATYVEGTGLTSFKIIAEVMIMFLMVCATGILMLRQEEIDHTTYRLLHWFIGLSLFAEVAFILYGLDVFGLLNMTGHMIRIFAYLALYHAVIAASLSRPLEVMFHDLSTTAMALGESEERFRTTFEQASVGIAHITPEGRWLRVNTRILEITGYSSDELETLTYRDITHPDDLGLEETLVDRLLENEIDQYRIEKRYVRKNGESVWVNVSRTLLRAEHGEPRYFISIIEDITARKRAEAALERRSDLNAALTAIDAHVNATLDIDDTLEKACEWAARGLGAESAAIAMRDSDHWVVRYAYDFPAPLIGESFSNEMVPHALLAADLGEPIPIDDATTDPRVNVETLGRFGIRSVLSVPLSLRSQHLGTLYLNFHSQSHHFTHEEVDFGKKLTTSLTLAIENSFLYESQLSIADTLQNALLRMPDSLPGVRIAHTYRSATELARIGGDFYDAFRVTENLIGFVIGDVSGKGLPAATLTATARSTIRAFAHLGDSPAAVLSKANDVIFEQVDESQFITAIYGTLDVATGLMTLACAGHPVPLFMRSGTCTTRTLDANAPLGIFAGQLYEEHSLVIGDEETVLLFSDGLLDARSSGRFLGEQGVCEIVERIGSEPIDRLVDGLMEAAQRHAGGHINDDVTIVALRLDRDTAETS